VGINQTRKGELTMSTNPVTNFQQWIRPQDFESETAEDITRGLSKKMAELDNVVNNAAARRQKVNQDANLSPEGKRQKIQEVAEDTAKRIDAVLPDQQGLESQIQSIEAEMQEPQPDPQDVSAQMRQREIRDRLYQMDEASRLNLYLKANESDSDPELIQAVENAPEAFPVVPAERVQEQKAIRIARKFPKQTAQLKDYRLYAQLLQQAAEFGKRQLMSR